MTIHVRFFAVFKQRLNRTATTIELPAAATVATAQAALGELFPAIDDLMPRSAVAVNREYVKPHTPLHDGDEMALIPPVSGG